MGKIRLTKTIITGEWDENIPFCVVEEFVAGGEVSHEEFLMLKNNMITAKELYRKILEKDIRTVENPYSQEDLQHIAKFINPLVSWDSDTLLEAFNNIIHNFINNRCAFPEYEFQYGAPVPSVPDRFSATIMYRICKRLQIELYRECTIEHMADYVDIYHHPDNILRTLFHNMLADIKDKRKLINIYRYIHKLYLEQNKEEQEDQEIQKEIQKDFPSRAHNILIEQELTAITSYNLESMQKADRSFKKIINFINRINPANNGEAIYLAAKCFKKDLSMAKDAVTEYNEMKKNPSNYQPVDPLMRKYLEYNPHIYDLDYYFNRLLPMEYYEDEDLEYMAYREGYTEEEMEEEHPYTLLVTRYLCDNFEHGIHPFLTSTETPIDLENIETVDADCVVCYGLRKMEMSNMQPFLYSELADCFNAYKSYKNPLDPDKYTFTKNQIRKLKNLCYEIIPDASQQSRKDRDYLLQTIAMVEIFNDEENEKIKALTIVYENASEETQKLLIETVVKLFHLAMYARGWKSSTLVKTKKEIAEEDYPIREAKVDANNLDNVEINVNYGMIDLYKKIKKLNTQEIKIGTAFLDLPLMIYEQDFRISNCEQIGKTIGEKLKIMQNNNDDNACIRMASNWLAATSYRLMQAFNMPLLFNIRELKEIT